MASQQQQKQQKPKKQKKKKLSKAERIALREQQQAKSQPKLSHPQDGVFTNNETAPHSSHFTVYFDAKSGDFGDLICNQSQYRVQSISLFHFPEISTEIVHRQKHLVTDWAHMD